MTLVLDTRGESFGEMYTTTGPCSSKNLESRRRRFSWITPIFEASEKQTTYNQELEAKYSSMDTNLTSVDTNDISILDSKEATTVFESFRRGSFSKAVKFLKSLVKEPKSGKQDNSSILSEESSSMGTFEVKPSGGIKSNGRESVKIPKEVVEQVLREQTSNNSLRVVDTNDNKPSLRRSKPILNNDKGGYNLSSPPSSPEHSLDLSDVSDISTHSVNVRNEANKFNKSIGKSNGGSLKNQKKSKSETIDKGGNRYIVNENGKIVPVQVDKQNIKGCLKVNNDKKELKFKKHTKSNGTPLSTISTHCKNLLGKSKCAKEFRFNEFVVIFETYSMEEYDRRMVNYLEQNLANTMNIKMELNDFKSKEMSVHPDSRKYTHFLTI